MSRERARAATERAELAAEAGDHRTAAALRAAAQAWERLARPGVAWSLEPVRQSITVRDRRDGKPGRLSQGVAFGNSDVGGGTLWMADFIFDYFCCNRIIWGLREVQELAIRHTASAPHRFMAEVVPALKEIARSQIRLQDAQIVAAQNAKIDDLDKFLTSRKFTRSQVAGIKAAYKTDEGIELGLTSSSIWDAVVGITAYARGIEYQDARVDIERAAGKILQMAA